MNPGDVGVWHADISLLESDAARLQRSLAWLRDDEQSRFARYRADSDRLNFLLGRVMARRLVGRALGVAPTDWQWGQGSHGRPEIETPATPLQFNLAHSSRLVACALAMNREVGVDVEDSQRAATDPAIVARFCSPDEAAAIRVGEPEWRERFLAIWTLKEAYLKARGLGISVHLSDISFSVGAIDGDQSANGPDVQVRFLNTLADADPHWTFRLVRAGPRYLLAVAAATPDGVQPAMTIEPFPADWLP